LAAPPSRTAHYTFFHQPKIEIPAGVPRHEITAVQYVPQAGVLLAILPHMHLIGREMKVTLKIPGGKKQSLIWIKDWDFNWQNQYVYKSPVLLPSGSTVVCVVRQQRGEPGESVVPAGDRALRRRDEERNGGMHRSGRQRSAHVRCKP